MNSIVSVVVPTLAELAREPSIRRCIASIRRATKHPCQIIVVINGGRFDKTVCDWLRQQNDLLVAQVKEGSLPIALAYGRSLVLSEFFSFLDDDDEYLPDSLDKKINLLTHNPLVDIAVSNGFRRISGQDECFFPGIELIERDPLTSLFLRNWLASCGALFRSSTVGQPFFDDPHPYAEWTWLAYNLAISGKQVKVINEPGFIIHDTPGSLSKSDLYRKSYLSLYERMLQRQPPAHIKKMLKIRLGAAYHDLSASQLAKGQWLDAWISHLSSLICPKGMHYLSYTRRLLPFWPKQPAGDL